VLAVALITAQAALSPTERSSATLSPHGGLLSAQAVVPRGI
jgi:hypothetical protein